MFYALALFVESLLITPMLAGAQPERYWSGRPQAVGIDLSTQYIHAAQYNATTKEFTNLAHWPCSDQFGSFMVELYRRKQLNDKNWQEDYFAYETWRPLRNIVQTTIFTSWIGDWIPQLSNEYRYSFNDNLDDTIIINPRKTLTLTDQLKSILSWQSSTSEQASEHGPAPRSLPLNTTNFVNVLALAIQGVKAEVLQNHGINITSAVIAKPSYINNDVDRLLDRACLKANLEVLDRRDRAEAARYIPLKAGKTETLVLEQSGHDFVLSKPSSSMRRDDLSASWIPVRLMIEMLDSTGFVGNGTAESLNAATQKLAVEIVRTRRNMKFAYIDDLGLFNEEETTIVVPNFGSKNFTFKQSLSGANISRAEKAYTEEVQLAIETMLLKRHEIHQFQKDNNLFDEISNDQGAPQTVMVNLAKTISHPEAASGGSWWDSIDALLVIADFPDASLIQHAAMRAIGSITNKKCGSVFSQDYVKHDLVARGAALHASDWVEYWDAEERGRRCSEAEDFYECWNAEMERERGRDEHVAHEEL